MTISRERHKSGVAAISMQLLDSDELCGGGGGGHNGGERERRVKEIEFTVEPSLSKGTIQRSAKMLVCGCEKFLPALA